MSRPTDRMTSKPVGNPASSDLQSREDSVPVQKSLWFWWQWKSVRSRVKPTKRTDLELPNSSGSRTSVDKPYKLAHQLLLKDIGHNFEDGFYIIDGGREACAGYTAEHPNVCIYKYDFATLRKEVSVLRYEMERLSQLRHPTLLSLIGYCDNCDDSFQDWIYLVYDSIGFGTLHSYLYGRNRTSGLLWKNWLQIGIGIAQGLDFLHKGNGKTIIHGEVSPINIVLDEDLSPKILNSGLSKLRPVERLEYLSPEEMISALQSSDKSDVYSFGLVLLELLCSQRRGDFDLHLGDNKRYLKNMVKNNIITKKFHQLLDSGVQRKIASTCLTEYLKIAFSCLHFSREKRPSMDYVIDKLKFALQLQEEAEAARKQDFKGKGVDDGFNLEDIYEDTSYLSISGVASG
ncbi:hypothetical protein ACH5RR_018980 [Cinchona calisaya]|uniref:Protein kinase domain-containing protein n=1 Tax=Cinchona calisaya TaxID=153742 RepID=A0ABD2ZN50_9GENT